MTYRRILFWICLPGFIIYLVIKIVNAFSSNAKAFDETLPSVHSLSPDVSDLIATNYIGKLEVNEILRSKVRNPISLLTFDGRYSLIIYEINLIENVPLKNLLYTEARSVDRSTGYTYNVVDNNIFRFQYKAGPTRPISEIKLTFSGDSLRSSIENDSLINFHLLCNNFSIRYGKNEPIDIYFECKKAGINATYISADLLFVKRDRKVYFLLLTPNDSKIVVSPDLLYDIVTGSTIN